MFRCIVGFQRRSLVLLVLFLLPFVGFLKRILCLGIVLVGRCSLVCSVQDCLFLLFLGCLLVCVFLASSVSCWLFLGILFLFFLVCVSTYLIPSFFSPFLFFWGLDDIFDGVYKSYHLLFYFLMVFYYFFYDF